MRATVLIGFAEALSSPEVAWSLVDGGFRVEAFARKGRCAALRHSRHVTTHEITAPELDAEAALTDLNSLLASLKANDPKSPLVLFPLDDSAVWLGSRAATEPGYLLAGPRDGAEMLALDKNVQLRAARAAGFGIIPTQFASTSHDVLDYEQTFPLIIKQAGAVRKVAGRLAKGRYWICDNRSELENAVRVWGGSSPLLIQPFVSGTGEGVFGLACQAEVQAWSAHRRLRMMNPHGSGSSAAISESLPADVREPARQFLRQTGWRGIFMIELLREPSGAVWFMEFNGRAWGSMALSRLAGPGVSGLEREAGHGSRLSPGSSASRQLGDRLPEFGARIDALAFRLAGPQIKSGQGLAFLLEIPGGRVKIGPA